MSLTMLSVFSRKLLLMFLYVKFYNKSSSQSKQMEFGCTSCSLIKIKFCLITRHESRRSWLTM